MLKKIVSAFPDGYKREIAIGTVNANTGEFTTFTNHDIPFEELPEVSAGSCSVPLFWQPKEYKGEYWIDGGTTYNIDPTDAVKACQRLGYDDEDIVVDIAICGHKPQQTEEKLGKSIDNFIRSFQLKNYYTNYNSYHQVFREYPRVNWRHLFIQENPSLPNAFDFVNETTWPMQMDGREQARKAIESLEKGVNGFVLLDEWERQQDQLKQGFGSFLDYYKHKVALALGLGSEDDMPVLEDSSIY